MGFFRRGDANWDETVDRRWIAALERSGRKLLYRLASLLVPSQKPENFSLNGVRRLLVVKEPYRMGDLLQITPLLRALRRQYPDLYIGLVIQDRNFEIFRHNPDVNEVFPYAKKEINRRPWAALSFVSGLRRKGFDAAVTLETQRTHLTNDLIALFSGAPVRIRYEGGPFGGDESDVFYNIRVPCDLSEKHEVRRNSGVLERLGLRMEDPRLGLRFSDADLASARGLLKRTCGRDMAEKGFVAVCPGAYKRNNRWPLDRYLEIGDRLRQKGLTAIYSLGPAEMDLKPEIEKSGHLLACGQSLLQLAAFLSLSRCVLCNDTGVMHVAAAVGSRTLALFSQTDPEQWRPPGDLVRVVRSPDRTMGSIPADAVWRSLAAELGQI